jgi:hypothetical protein
MRTLWFRGSATVVLLTGIVLLPMRGTAVARGGHSHGRMHGVGASPTVVQPVGVRAQAAVPAAASLPATTVPASAAKAASAPLAPPPAASPIPASQIGTPAPQLQAIAPLSPAATTLFLTGGGTRSDTAASSSSSEAAPSVAGGGGKSMADCMGFWDRATHMTKAEWKGACARSLDRLATLKVDTLGPTQAKNGR